jgi:hypothetical protein
MALADLPFLTARNRQAARLLAEGLTVPETSKQLGMTQKRIHMLLADERFKLEVEQAALRMSQTIEDQIIEELVQAERKAVIVVEELMDSKDEEIRLKAALTMLDRAGRRGKVADKVEQRIATYNMNQAQRDQAKLALRDPGVRALLPPEIAQKVLDAAE